MAYRASHPASHEAPLHSHCSRAAMTRQGNAHMNWWKCRFCKERLMQQKYETGARTIYYLCPPCPTSDTPVPAGHEYNRVPTVLGHPARARRTGPESRVSTDGTIVGLEPPIHRTARVRIATPPPIHSSDTDRLGLSPRGTQRAPSINMLNRVLSPPAPPPIPPRQAVPLEQVLSSLTEPQKQEVRQRLSDLEQVASMTNLEFDWAWYVKEDLTPRLHPLASEIQNNDGASTTSLGSMQMVDALPSTHIA